MKRQTLLLPGLALLAFGCSPGSVTSGGPIGPDPGGPDASPGPTTGRAVAGLQALYTFKEGTGAVINDVSGVGDALNLSVVNPAAASWLPGGGLNVTAPTVLLAEVAPTSMVTACQASGAVTLEAWVKSNDVGQNGYVMTLSNGNDTNFDLSQSGDLGELDVYVHTTDEENAPINLAAPPAFNGQIRHIVYTRNGLDDQASIFIDGQRQLDDVVAGGMGNWGLENFQLALANDVDQDAEWRGEFYLAAVYCRNLSAAEVFQNYDVGY